MCSSDLTNVSTGTLAVARGGTGQTTLDGIKSALDLEIGTDVQAQNVHLQDLADDGILPGSKVGSGFDATNITTGILTLDSLTSGAYSLSQVNSSMKIGVSGGRNTTAAPDTSYGNLAIGNFQIFTDGDDDYAPQGLVVKSQYNPDADGDYALFLVDSSGGTNRFSVVQGTVGYANQFTDSLIVGSQ